MYGGPTTVWRRLKRWGADGTGERICRAALAAPDWQGRLDWALTCLDGSFVTAKNGGGMVGLTWKGKGTKWMLVIDGNGMPLGFHLDSARFAEVRPAERTLDTVTVARSRGRPRQRPDKLVADRRYDSSRIRRTLRRRGLGIGYPPKRSAAKWRAKRGRLVAARKEDCRQCSKVERIFAWLGNCRRLLILGSACWSSAAVSLPSRSCSCASCGDQPPDPEHTWMSGDGTEERRSAVDAGWRKLSRDQLRRLFMVPPFPSGTARFLAFERGTPVPDQWDIVGLCERRHDPFLLEVLLITVSQAHIVHLSDLYAPQWSPDEASGDPPLNLAVEEPGTIGFTPEEYQRLIHLLERYLDAVPGERRGTSGTHFRRMAPPEQAWPPSPDTLFSEDPCYRYQPDADIPAAESRVAVLSLPDWQERSNDIPIGYLGFLVFDRSRFADPDFDPYIEYGLGYITLNAGALRDLIGLLRRHAYRA
jgi:hypothetical protein